MKVATWNVNSIRKRLPILLDWLEHHQPDVLCLQETKVQDKDFPELAIRTAGYQAVYRGISGFNGVATLTRQEPERDRKSTRLNSSHYSRSRMPSSA